MALKFPECSILFPKLDKTGLDPGRVATEWRAHLTDLFQILTYTVKASMCFFSCSGWHITADSAPHCSFASRPFDWTQIERKFWDPRDIFHMFEALTALPYPSTCESYSSLRWYALNQSRELVMSVNILHTHTVHTCVLKQQGFKCEAMCPGWARLQHRLNQFRLSKVFWNNTEYFCHFKA